MFDISMHPSLLIHCGASHLVDSYRFSVEFDHVHDFDGVVCVVLPHELHEAVALVVHGHPVLGHVNVHWRSQTHSYDQQGR